MFWMQQKFLFLSNLITCLNQICHCYLGLYLFLFKYLLRGRHICRICHDEQISIDHYLLYLFFHLGTTGVVDYTNYEDMKYAVCSTHLRVHVSNIFVNCTMTNQIQFADQETWRLRVSKCIFSGLCSCTSSIYYLFLLHNNFHDHKAIPAPCMLFFNN